MIPNIVYKIESHGHLSLLFFPEISWRKLVTEFHFFARNCLDLPTPFVEEAIFAPFYAPAYFVKYFFSFFFSFFFFFYCYSITVVCLFAPSLHPTPAEPTSLPPLHPPSWFCPCVLYSSSCNPLSSLSPPHSPLALVRLFFVHLVLGSRTERVRFLDSAGEDGELRRESLEVLYIG